MHKIIAHFLPVQLIRIDDVHYGKPRRYKYGCMAKEKKKLKGLEPTKTATVKWFSFIALAQTVCTHDKEYSTLQSREHNETIINRLYAKMKNLNLSIDPLPTISLNT